MIHADRDFTARIARISSGKQYEAENVIGQRSMKVYEKAKKRGRFEAKPQVSLIRELMVTPIALLFGMLAVLAARVSWFQMTSRELMPKQVGQFGVQGELTLALLVALIFLVAFHLRSGTRLYALVAGFALMAFGESAFAETAPTLWTMMFSPGYFTEVVHGGTLAASLL